MPIELEVGLLAQKFHTTPGYFGLDDSDPRLIRTINTCLGVYETAIAFASAEKKSEWNKRNPNGQALLRWARSGESSAPDPNEVRIVLPERPKRRG